MLRSERLRELRLKANFSQDHLANLLDLKLRQISRYESGENDPAADVISRMADVFNVSADYLLGRTDDPTPCSQSGELTALEQEILAAFRRGDRLAAIRLIASDSG